MNSDSTESRLRQFAVVVILITGLVCVIWQVYAAVHNSSGQAAMAPEEVHSVLEEADRRERQRYEALKSRPKPDRR